MEFSPSSVQNEAYRQSIDRLFEYVGLGTWKGPPHDLPESCQPQLEGPHDTLPKNAYGIYFREEQCPVWQAYLRTVPAAQRHTETVRRRIASLLRRHLERGYCRYCWIPTCICEQLEVIGERLEMLQLGKVLQVTMVLHAEELTRSTNTGHIAAMVLNAPLRVWGVPEDDIYLRDLQALSAMPASSLPPAPVAPTAPRPIVNVLLYPEEGAVLMNQLLRTSHNDMDKQEEADPSRTRSHHPICLHLLLSDATWSQAHRVNRHVSRDIQRVGLLIPENYVSLFAPLRKQTRDTGVSTLEATVMAAAQRLEALNRYEDSQHFQGVMIEIMKNFVDRLCLQKFQDMHFGARDDPQAVKMREQRDAWRSSASQRHVAQRDEFIESLSAAEFRSQLLPPVLNFCYACCKYVKWTRMVHHIMGIHHRAMLQKNPICFPTEQSRNVVRRAQGQKIQRDSLVPQIPRE